MSLAGFQKSPTYILYHFYWRALDWLYPPYCGGCDRLGERWCTTCQELTPSFDDKICQICGQPQKETTICFACRTSPPNYKAMRSYSAFMGSLREAIHRLKYENDIGLGEALASLLIGFLNTLNWPIDLITPVPLSRSRLKQRGYNQADLLARPLALAKKIPYSRKAIKRIRDTESQTELSAQERMQNVSGAFLAKSAQVSGKTVLIIDDVATTGATIQACAQALLTAGAKDVYALTLARAILEP